MALLVKRTLTEVLLNIEVKLLAAFIRSKKLSKITRMEDTKEYIQFTVIISMLYQRQCAEHDIRIYQYILKLLPTR
jgi:hypothetical protein